MQQPMPNEPTPLDVLRHARAIVRDGGDPNPCEIGPYCLRCCLGIAKGDVDAKHGTGLSGIGSLIAMGVEVPSDAPLIQSRDAVARYDPGISHSKESALALLDRVIEELEGVR